MKTAKPWIALVAGLLLTACAAAPGTGTSPTAVPGVSPAGAGTAIPHVTAEEAKALQDKGENLLFVDVRSKASYDIGHIEGAVSHPWATLPQTHTQLPKDRTLMLYCTCPDEHSSAGAAGDLQAQFGFTKLMVLKGGMQGWMAKGYPTANSGTGQ
ncbi:MAG: rhodanese-like domain-containing protein [Candidatus Sericytochromatia bacterium]